MSADILAAGAVFDGRRMWPDAALVIEDGRVAGIVPRGAVPSAAVTELGEGTLAPGFVDVQVNGAGGRMFCADPSVGTLRLMSDTLARLGTLHFLPTLITSDRDTTRAAIDAAVKACGTVPGVAGLHLEGPHLDPARAGAHDPALIRPMGEDDLALYLEAARRLPVLKITLAPEAARPEQIAALAAAGVVVSLGHSDCSFAAAEAAIRAGARCVTHLFNAMSPLQGRAPGLVGAALAHPVHVGLIADGLHVDPVSIRLALRAKAGRGACFLVSDAMAVAGTALERFTLNGREILRRDGRLTLADGTLAGADLDLPGALRVMTGAVGLAPEEALAMAGALPAEVVGLGGDAGLLAPGGPADLVWLGPGLDLRGVWRGGRALPLAGAG